jgi:aryl-alcohol dehydrogenase-like predicted oxidoreductase
MTREVELEVLPAAKALGVGVIPWSPLHGGLLGGVLGKQGRRRQAGRSAAALELHHAAIEAYEGLCESLGEQPANVALAWLLHQEAVTAPIIGPRTTEQLEQAQRAVELTLDQDVLNQLDSIFPGYKTAPEHYAW